VQARAEAKAKAEAERIAKEKAAIEHRERIARQREETLAKVQAVKEEALIRAEAERIVSEAVANAEADSRARKIAARPVYYGPELEPPGIGYLHQLMAMTDGLDRPFHVAEEISALAVQFLGCDAVAVLIPDGDVWTIAGGIGVKARDTRHRLTEEHWFVREVLGREAPFVIDGDDPDHIELKDVPLGYWGHLAGIPMVDANSIVVAARSDDAFTLEQVTEFAEGIEEIVAELADALGARDVARQIHDRRRR
jgi:hypothetical protein